MDVSSSNATTLIIFLCECPIVCAHVFHQAALLSFFFSSNSSIWPQCKVMSFFNDACSALFSLSVDTNDKIWLLHQSVVLFVIDHLSNLCSKMILCSQRSFFKHTDFHCMVQHGLLAVLHSMTNFIIVLASIKPHKDSFTTSRSSPHFSFAASMQFLFPAFDDWEERFMSSGRLLWTVLKISGFSQRKRKKHKQKVEGCEEALLSRHFWHFRRAPFESNGLPDHILFLTAVSFTHQGHRKHPRRLSHQWKGNNNHLHDWESHAMDCSCCEHSVNAPHCLACALSFSTCCENETHNKEKASNWIALPLCVAEWFTDLPLGMWMVVAAFVLPSLVFVSWFKNVVMALAPWAWARQCQFCAGLWHKNLQWRSFVHNVFLDFKFPSKLPLMLKESIFESENVVEFWHWHLHHSATSFPMPVGSTGGSGAKCVTFCHNRGAENGNDRQNIKKWVNCGDCWQWPR